VPAGDRKALAKVPAVRPPAESQHRAWVVCSSTVMSWMLFEGRQLNGAHSLHASKLGPCNCLFVFDLAQSGHCTDMALSILFSQRQESLECWAGRVKHKRGRGKHDFAAHKRGARSYLCCGESPRAAGQRVPAGDRKALAKVPAARPLAEPQHQARVVCSSTAMS
jgi:hypothetical protein